MSAKCSICTKTTSGKKAKIQCNNCQSFFHGSCVNLSEVDVNFYLQEGEVWRCDPCTQARRKSMRVESELEKSEPNVSDVIKLLHEMREENKKQIKDLETDLGKSVESGHERIEELKIIITSQSEALKNIEQMYSNIAEENMKLKKTVCQLEQRLEDMEQYSRVNCLEINGIPEETNENVLEIVKKVGVSLDLTITDEMVDICHRVGQKTQDRARGIIVKFTRRTVKENMLQKRRVKRNLNTKDLGFHDKPATVVYLNENLTAHRRKIFNEARTVKKEKGYQFVWIRNGKIFLRKNEGDKAIVVTTMEQVSALRENK